MNKLEQQIFHEFNNPVAYSLYGKPGFELEEHYARIAAKIALELAERAYNVGSRDPEVDNTVSFEDFKQEIL